VIVPPALYDFQHEPGEQKSVLKNRPKVEQRMRKYMDEARVDLGDSLTGAAPKNARPVGNVDD
jgi:hypothetical protein